MKNVLEACVPRDSIVQGTFNPEVFTAAIRPVVEYYKSGTSSIDELYTDAVRFFRDATYPTEGLKQTVSSVFRRISGDNTAPSIYRAETGFGGGKTHMLIACTHIAARGTELKEVTKDILDSQYLPDPGSVVIVGVAGDEISVTRTKGEKLVPHTLWGEIAYQVGGEDLYRQVREQAEAPAAPGEAFLAKVLGGKKVLIMLDEMAQYAVRLDSIQKNGAGNLAAFLMSLYGYAKTHSNIAVIVTLAGSSDAFSKYTELLKTVQEDTGNDALTSDDIAAMTEKASRDITSVTMRDATGVTPVQASEISSVLAKRLFVRIDMSVAEEVAEAYYQMYQISKNRMPDEAVRVDFRNRMISNYPFHPTLVDFLNNKLAQAENFQGTRGVLRVLAMTVRSIWQKRTALLMIHTSDLDLHNNNLVTDLLGRTGNSELRTVLTADVGSESSNTLVGGLSNAQQADKRNPHPDKIPMYEMTWKVVFLNSLVGRMGDRSGNVFGISEKDAIFAVATPLLTPPQVEQALKEITESAFYLRFEGGKYYAATEPTINSVLSSIRRTITDAETKQHVRGVVNRMIVSSSVFEIVNNVTYSQDIPDNRDKPLLCVVSPDAGEVNIQEMFTLCGTRIRVRQNSMILLVPRTVKTIAPGVSEQIGFDTMTSADEAWLKVQNLARQVLAMKKLGDKPAEYGIAKEKLQDPEYVAKKAERNNALMHTVNGMYTTLWYPVSGSAYEHKELQASSSEGSVGLVDQIIQLLLDSGELVTSQHTDREHLTALEKLFFSGLDHIAVSEILDHFYQYRSWPILDSTATLQQLLTDGVAKELWIAYKMPSSADAERPKELFTAKQAVPMNVSLLDGGYSVMTVPGASKRGWLEKAGPEQREVDQALRDAFASTPSMTLKEAWAAVYEVHPTAKETQIADAVSKQLSASQIAVYTGTTAQQERPDDLMSGFAATMRTLHDDDVLITRMAQSERGWLVSHTSYTLSGQEARNKVLPLLKRLSSLYIRGGAKTVIESLDIADMKLPNGGTIRLALDGVGPEDIKLLGELLAAFTSVAQSDEHTDVSLEIGNPDDKDALMQELKK